MPAKCTACGKFCSSRADIAGCGKCEAQYHRACIGLAPGGTLPKDWTCPECKKNVQRDNKAETPVRGITTPIATTNLFEDDFSRIRSELKLFSTELVAVREELSEFRVEFQDMRRSLARMDKRIDGLEQRVNMVENQKTENVNSVEIKALENSVAELQNQINEREQDLFANDLQLSNVPESSGEIPVQLAAEISIKLGLKVDERDIVSAVRMGARREGHKPRPIVVRVSRKTIRDEFLKAARVRRGVTTAGMTISGEPVRFYINERLTRINRQLFGKARELARERGWRFVWTKDGRVHVRQAEGSNVYRIRCEAELLRVFHTNPV